MQPRDPEKVFRILADVAHAQLPDTAPPEQERHGFLRLEAHLRRERPPLLARLLGAGQWRFALAGVAIAGATLAAWPRDGRLSYTIDGGTEGARGQLAAPGDSGRAPTVRFSDGTEVALASGARGRVAAVTDRGAKVVLEDGTARVQVAKRPRAQWSFAAGPYEVVVTGTAFDLRWSEAQQRLDVDLRSGSVVVRGPMTGGGVPLRAGQRLVAVLPARRLEVADGAGPAGIASGPVVVPVAAPEPAGPAEAPSARLPERAAARARREAPRSWAQRVGAGEHDGVLREAERLGVAQVFARGSGDDLAALADAARYAKRPELARRSLLAQRQRFPRSPRAHDAAFLLGRLAEDVGGRPREALRWYDTYLTESRDGAFAAEALGRKMLVLHKTTGRPRACAAAKAYLAREPGGPYAKMAKELASEPCPGP